MICHHCWLGARSDSEFGIKIICLYNPEAYVDEWARASSLLNCKCEAGLIFNIPDHWHNTHNERSRPGSVMDQVLYLTSMAVNVNTKGKQIQKTRPACGLIYSFIFSITTPPAEDVRSPSEVTFVAMSFCESSCMGNCYHKLLSVWSDDLRDHLV